MGLLRFVTRLSILLCIAASAVQGETPAAYIRSIGDDLMGIQYRRFPNAATYYGNYEYNDLNEPFNIKQFKTEKREVKEYLNRLKEINRDELTDAEQVNYDLLKNKFKYFLDGNIWALYTLTPLTYFEGIHRFVAGMAVSSTLGDFENYIARLSVVPEQVDDIIERCQLAIELKHTLHNISIAPVVDFLGYNIFNQPEKSPYFSPFGDKLDNSNVKDKQLIRKLRKRGEEAVTLLMDAMQKLKDFLELEYLPNTRAEYGVFAWDSGFYAACLRWHLTLDMTPEEVHSIGLAEVRRINSLMKKAMKRLGFRGTTRQFFDSLKGDQRFFAKDSAEVLAYYQDLIDQVKPKMPEYFGTYPDLPIVVRASTGLLASYTPVTENSPGYFNVNVQDPNDHPFYGAMPLAVHEALPGHHLQFSYNLVSDLPDYRTLSIGRFYNVPYEFPGYTSHIEGWGLYSEYLAEEMGLYKDDYDMMGRYLFEMLRAVRLVVDTGLHYKGWSREKSIAYYMRYVAQSENVATSEIDRYITWPGQACAYKIGEIFIKNMRLRAEDELGDAFDIAEFHAIFLENGFLPLSLLEKRILAWIADTKVNTGKPEPE